jgi:hypothetical protein
VPYEHTAALDPSIEATGSATQTDPVDSQSATESNFSGESSDTAVTQAGDEQAIQAADRELAEVLEDERRAMRRLADAAERLEAARATYAAVQAEDGAGVSSPAGGLTADEAQKRVREASVRAKVAENRSQRAIANRRAVEFHKTIAGVESEINEIRQHWVLLNPRDGDERVQRAEILDGLSLIIESNKDYELLAETNWRTILIRLLQPLRNGEPGEAALSDNLGEALRHLHLESAKSGATEARLSRIRSAINQQDIRSMDLKRRESLKRIETAEHEATTAAASAKKAAGTAGEAVLTGHFKSYAAEEYRRSYLYLGGAIVSLIAAILAAAFVVWGADVNDIGWREGLRAVVSLPLLGLAYYLSRESSVHSEAARKAHEIEVRLATIEAFTQVMAEPQRQDLRNTLGHLVYSRTDLFPMHGANNLGKEATEALDALKVVASTASKEIAESGKKIADAGKSS